MPCQALTSPLSFSTLPGLDTGTVDAAIFPLSPVYGLRPVRAGRFLVPKVPNPGIRASSPFARACPMTLSTLSTASFAAVFFMPVWPARRPASSTLMIHALPYSRNPSALLRE